MIERAIAILQEAGFDFTAKELADIFWLAVQMEPSPQSPLPQPKKHPELPIVEQQDSLNQSSDIPKSQLPETPATQEPKAPISLPTSQPKTGNSTQSQEAIPIKVPAATALRNALALGRALRPLMRKVPSFTEQILDEEATVYRFAEDQIGMPVLKSTPERWLELALVIEETTITEIWEPTIREFQRLLKHHGAFRDVRTWKLKAIETYSRTKVQLFPQNSTGINESTPHNPNVLIDPKGRRLILLISDCISPIWRKKLIHPVLDLWGKRGLVTILQLLPERFWNRTALVDEIPVLLSSLTAGVYNSRLIAELWDEDDIDDFADENPSEILSSLISIPVITLESEPLLIWSKVIAGQGNISTAGFKFNLLKEGEISEQSPTTPHLSASDLVNRFRATASLQARQLAGLMAASPVSVSVVHLIQQTLLPDSTQIHVAEVFISGLLKRIPISRQDNPDYITYEFIDGVRELLRDFVPSNKQISVIDKLSEFIAKTLNLSRDKFEAQILKYQENDDLEKQIRPFAQLKVQVLRQLGGDYSLEAEKLEAINKISHLSSFSNEYAGEYACAVKWGGETGTWQKESEPEHLLISQQGEVQFRSRFGLAVIQNLTVEEKTLSWSFENNETAASINFKENSENNYFWSEHQTGKLFEGWLNYPNEGRIDFRGRLVISDDFPPVQELIFEVATITIELELEIQPFEFEVAIIELERKLINLGRKAPVIKRSRQQAQCFIEEISNGVQLEMVSIPEGSFMMGAPRNEKDSIDSDRPQHLVTVQPFFIGKYTVTQSQWKAVAALSQVNRELNPDPSNFKGVNHPVELVSWYDAVEFCDRLSQHTGRLYSLPSEAEWEYACRAGTTTPFHFGETLTSELANYRANEVYGAGVKGTYREKTTSVGSLGVANAFGLYDMHGNVWEWCLDDWHSNYEDAPNNGSAWFDGDENDNFSQKQGNAVLRGGSWIDNPRYCRSASRHYNNRDFHDTYYGFRVVGAFGRILQ